MAKIEYIDTLIKAIQNSDLKATKMIIDSYGYRNFSELLNYLQENDFEMLKYLVQKGARIPDFITYDDGMKNVLSMDNVNKILVTLVNKK